MSHAYEVSFEFSFLFITFCLLGTIFSRFCLISNALCASAYVCRVWFPQPFSSSGAHLTLLLGKFGGSFFFQHVLTISIVLAVEFAPVSMLGTSVGQLDASAWLPKPSISSMTHFGPPALSYELALSP